MELIPEELRSNPAITFSRQLDQHLVAGSYDLVMLAAANPPTAYYSYFLASLLETVRLNIGDCVGAAYETLTVEAATKILMFTNKQVIYNNHNHTITATIVIIIEILMLVFAC